jgi:flavodoxin
MKALVIYDSTYGNTEKIANAIGGAIAGDVKVVPAAEADPTRLQSIDLLIVGSPTQGFRPTKSVQAFIDGLPGSALRGKKVAAFDTRVPVAEVGRGLRQIMKMGGYAAPRIGRALEKRGGIPAAPPEGFFVKDKEGPLVEGEQESAAGWAKEVAKYLPPYSRTPGSLTGERLGRSMTARLFSGESSGEWRNPPGASWYQ